MSLWSKNAIDERKGQFESIWQTLINCIYINKKEYVIYKETTFTANLYLGLYSLDGFNINLR